MATERIVHHIERLREKPHHVRHRIAMLTALVATGVIVVGWAAALTTSGALALKSEPVRSEEGAASPESDISQAFSESKSAFSNLVGAAGAAFGATSSQAALKVLDTRTSSTLNAESRTQNNTDKTVIPF